MASAEQLTLGAAQDAEVAARREMIRQLGRWTNQRDYDRTDVDNAMAAWQIAAHALETAVAAWRKTR